MPRWLTDAADAVADAVPDASRGTLPGQTRLISPGAPAALIEFITA